MTIIRSTKSVIRRINNEGIQTGRISRKNAYVEKFTGSDLVLADKLDDLCRTEADKEFETVTSLKEALRKIERGADKLGCLFKLALMNGVTGSPHYDEYSVDEFCVKAKRWLRDSTYLSIDFVDGDPGDMFMLCFHDYDDPDVMEECAQFIFDQPPSEGMSLRR